MDKFIGIIDGDGGEEGRGVIRNHSFIRVNLELLYFFDKLERIFASEFIILYERF